MWSEIKIGLRGLLKSPGFTAIAIATLALAIGANSAVFSLIDALLVRPLPYHDPSRLTLLWERFPDQGLERIPVSAPEYNDYEQRLKSAERIAAFNYLNFNMAEGNRPERVSGAMVSPSLFPLLGVEPIIGRTFIESEQGPGRDDVVVLSERLWKRRFNSDPHLVGKSVLLNGRNYNVVGVMPASFEFPIPLFGVQGNQFAERVDIWKPVAFTPLALKERGSREYGVIVRLRPGVSVTRAQAELETFIAQSIRDHPEAYGDVPNGFGARLYPFQDQVVGGMRNGLTILCGAVVFVLLIACANLATMLLARASVRERELAIRAALGAAPWRLLRQLLTESVLLAIGGAAVGLMLAVWGIALLKNIGTRTVPRLAEVNIDLTVLAVTAGVAITTGILFGLVPALAAAKPELTEALKEGGRSSTVGSHRNRIRNVLVVAEIALALVLLVGAGLMIKSFVRLQNVSPGFNPHNVLTAEISLPSVKYPSPGAEYLGTKTTADFFAEADRRMAKLPGVEAAAATAVLPLSGTNGDSSFYIEGSHPGRGEPFPDEEIRLITPDYFRVLQVPLLQGRFFTDADTADSPPVVIVNQALVRKYFPNGDALGKRITFDDPRKDPKWTTIVGIVGSIRHRSLDLEPQPEYYLPHRQVPSRTMILTLRTAQDPPSLISAVRREIQSLDPDQPIANVRTLETVVSESIAPRRLSVILLGVFSVIALTLAAVGTYGVMSYLVIQRTHEIGVRMALGAGRTDVLRLVVGHALKLVVFGTATGLVLSILSTRALASLLYNVGRFDFVTFVIVTFVLGGAALLASYVPAIRALRADPMIALTHNA